MEVISINIGKRFALLSDSETVVPITTLIDSDGDTTDDPAEAVTFVAGRDGVGWFTDRIGNFVKLREN
jgi:hypothetical protein